ncbi:MAG TPA: cytochrome c oxidase subunit 3 [Candidatus Binatia bacterium]|nr:cytochrome c oxidase subunit 3 [Candidatus Binatia bacterium]
MVGRVLEAPPALRRRTNGYVPPPPPPTGGGDGPEGEPPRRPLLDNLLLATLFFVGAEIVFFAGLVSAFWVLRLAAPVWPPPLQPRLPVGLTAVNTAVLLVSSVFLVRGLGALRRGERRTAVRRLTLTAGLGAFFLVAQGVEWARLLHFGLTMSSGTYGATFYTLIGAHAVHVLGALIWLAVTTRRLARGRLLGPRPAALRACAFYWHFVVALWPVLYVSIYLL